MPTSRTLNIGMIGYGFMGRAHSNAYRKVNQFFPVATRPVMKAAAARSAGELRSFADNWGWESTETDWRRLVHRKDIDPVDICSPNNTHLEIALRAAANGKMVLCEKPLAMDAAEGKKMVAAVEKARVPNMVWFNYRRGPALALARPILDEGRVGEGFHYRAAHPQGWALSPEGPPRGRALGRVAQAGPGARGS